MVDINDRKLVALKLHSAMVHELQRQSLLEVLGNGDWCVLTNRPRGPGWKMFFFGYEVIVDDNCPDWEFVKKAAP